MIGRRTILGGVVAGAMYPRGAAFAASWQAPLICAHRGWIDPSRADNSLIQMRQTTQAGPFMVEFDLALDASGSIVLMHDETVTRTTDGTGRVASLTDEQIARLRLRDGHGLTAEAPPHFSSVLAWAGQAPSALLMLDIKGVPPEVALPPVGRAGLASRVVVLTFSHDLARRALRADPTMLVSMLVTNVSELAAYVHLAAGRRFVAYVPHHADPAVFHAAQQAGALVLTDLLGKGAITDSEPPAQAAQWARGLPLDILVTNTPVALRAAFGADGGTRLAGRL